MTTSLFLVALFVVAYASLALWLGRRSVSMPLAFVAIGFFLARIGAISFDSPFPAGTLTTLSQVTLALLLFADASTLDLRQVGEDARLPLRLLTIGMLLTIVVGALVAVALFPGEGLAFAALLGAILAPTDAALGLPIFTNLRIPVRIRRALNVESGLNDGIATPFVALFLAFATAAEEHLPEGWLAGALSEIAIGVGVGALVGLIGSWLLLQTSGRGWTAGGAQQIAILGLALVAYFAGLTVHGNGFIATFVGGIVFGSVSHSRFCKPTEFTETFSTFLSLLVWVIFGAVIVPTTLACTQNWLAPLYAVLSLTLVRMVPVAIALAGTRLRADTVALMGWFGPRGLASVVFTLLAFVQLAAVSRPIDTLVACAGWTILLSVLAHGLSAQPLSAWYARRLARTGVQPMEMKDLPELRKRHAAISGPLHSV